MATIYKKRGMWFIDYVLRGKKITRNTKIKATNENRLKAVKLKNEIEAILTEGLDSYGKLDRLIPDKLTLNKAIELYARIFIEGKTKSHAENFDYVMRKFKTIVPGNTDVKEIKIEHISKFVTSMKNNLSQATIYTYFQYISSMFIYLKESGYIELVPISKAIRPEKAKKNIISFNPTDLNNILELAKMKDLRYYMAFKLFLLTGQRPGDVLKLKVRDFDMFNKVININVSKTASEFKFPIYNALEIFLKEELKIQDYNELDIVLFSNMTVNAFGKAFRKIKKDLGLNKYHYYTLKTFRKNFATEMSKLGLTIQEVQALLDHKSTSTTLRYYANVKADELKDKINKLNSNR